MKKLKTVLIPLLILFPFSLSGVINTAQVEDKEVFNASALARRGTGGGMVVEHWTTAEETRKLLQAFNEGGSDELFREMRKMRAGLVSGYFGFEADKPMPSSIGVLNLAFSKQTQRGRLIHLVIERPLLPFYFSEYQPLPQPQDYEFGLVELVLDEEGEGQGTHFPSVRIGISKDGSIEFTSLAREPEKLVWATKID